MSIKSALVARGTFVLCEYDASTCSDDLNEISHKVLAKIPRTGSCRSYVYAGHTFNYLLDKELIFLCIASMDAGTELVFQFLEEFRQGYSTRTRAGSGSAQNAELTKMLMDVILQYNEASSGGKTKVGRVEHELEGVTELMRDNIGKVMERGEKIESLLDKTSNMNQDSMSFRKRAKKYNNDLWWRDQRGQMLLGLLVLAVVTVASWYVWSSWHHQVHPSAKFDGD